MLTLDEVGKAAAIRRLAAIAPHELDRVLSTCPAPMAEAVRAYLANRGRPRPEPEVLRMKHFFEAF